ncbi:MAG: Hpt domain-containing protein [Lachnospiraceae bacterium]|nr:Hpt domain-containing protein [Lachnospiraceae bacterium]
MTIEDLRAYGANVEEGLGRCINNEAFYLKLVGKAVADPAFGQLEKAVADKDLDEAFEAAHKLKGALGNLALTPVYEPLCEMVELLRKREDADYGTYMERISQKRQELEALV